MMNNEFENIFNDTNKEESFFAWLLAMMVLSKDLSNNLLINAEKESGDE